MKFTQIKNVVFASCLAGLLVLFVGAVLQQTFAGDNRPASKPQARTKSTAQKNVGKKKQPPAPLPKPEPWTGFLKNETLPKLPNPVKVNNKVPFKIGVIQNLKDFNTVAAGALTNAKGKNEALPRWSKEIDWNREMVAYVVLTNSTNALSYKGYQITNKRSELLLTWSGIEPFYAGRQYALLCRFPRGRLTQLSVLANNGKLQHLADIQFMPK